MRYSFSTLMALGIITQATSQTEVAASVPELNMSEIVASSAGQLLECFEILSAEIESSKDMTMSSLCEVRQKGLPTVDGLPGPAEGLMVKHVAIGRGTQNYTCDSTNATASPSPEGAVAILYDATCIASSNPDLLSLLPSTALQFNLTLAEALLPFTTSRQHLLTSGVHFFTGPGVPFFDLDTPDNQIGQTHCSLDASVDPPPGAPVGQRLEPAVNWLKLLASEEAGSVTGNLREVFRVDTAGGNAPETCEGMPAAFEVQYAAQYWFFATDEGDGGNVAVATDPPIRQEAAMSSSCNLNPQPPGLIVFFQYFVLFLSLLNL